MPLYRHECLSCGVESLDLLRLHDPPPAHCSAAMRRIMPRRVVGRVAPDSNGVHTGSGFASTGRVDDGEIHDRVLAAASCMPSSAPPSRPIDPDNKLDIPWHTKPQPKDYTECNAGERDARWHDTCERMTEFLANGYEQDGMSRGDALRRASQLEQQVIEQARASNVREDGLT
jgi:predicted nucleic acid-binding Zn ribbon protein